LVAGSDCGLFSAKINNEKYRHTPLEGSVFSVCLDGDCVATGSYNEACIFDIKTGKKLIAYKYKGEDKRIFSVDLDGDVLALGFVDGNVRAINIKTGERLISRKYKGSSVQSVHLNHGRLATGFSDGDVCIFEVQTHKKLMSYPHTSKSVRLIDNYLAIGSFDGMVRIIDTQTSQEYTFKPGKPLYSLDFDGNRIAVGLQNKSCILKKYTDYTLEQLQLKCAFTTWLLLEKPNKDILKLKNKNDRALWLLVDVAKKCSLDYNKECVEVWKTFPIGMQKAIRRTMMHRIRIYGKNITDNTKKRGKK
jgi:WD40 repeat protein